MRIRIGWPLRRHDSLLVPTVSAKRLAGNPIISPEMLPGNDGANINGPSLIRVPDWLPGKLGQYYLYFAHHTGTYIRLAYSDRLDGPWSVHEPGTLHLDDANFCRGHIASPDVHVDESARQIRMYFHGVHASTNEQRSFLATSSDGIRFRPRSEVLGDFYLRVVRWNNRWVAMAKGGVTYISATGVREFVPTPAPAFELRHNDANLPGSVRHVALDMIGNSLQVYYTKIGDAPERILRSRINLDAPKSLWRGLGEELVLTPEAEWEGASLRVRKSSSGPSRGRERAVRDPAIFTDGGKKYLLYSVAGESGIGIALLNGPQTD